MVTAGDTLPLDAVPGGLADQLHDVGLLMQLAVNVEELPERIVDGLASGVHTGAAPAAFTVNVAVPAPALPHATGVTVTVYGDPDAGQLPAEVMKEPVEVVLALVHAAPPAAVHEKVVVELLQVALNVAVALCVTVCGEIVHGAATTVAEAVGPAPNSFVPLTV